MPRGLLRPAVRSFHKISRPKPAAKPRDRLLASRYPSARGALPSRLSRMPHALPVVPSSLCSTGSSPPRRPKPWKDSGDHVCVCAYRRAARLRPAGPRDRQGAPGPARRARRGRPRQPPAAGGDGRARPARPAIRNQSRPGSQSQRDGTLPAPRNPRLGQHRGRDRAGAAGPRQLPVRPVRRPSHQRQVPGRRSRRHHRRLLRAVRGRSRLGRRRPAAHGREGQRRLAADRREDLDLQRSRGRRLHRLRPHHAGRARPRHHRVRRRRRRHRPDRRAPRHARPACHRPAHLRRRQSRPTGCAGRGRPRLQDRHAHAGCATA